MIQLYSGIFELRLCMLLDNKYWVAKISDKPENCDIKLAFFGKLRFEHMVRMPKKCPPLYLNPLVAVDEDDNGNQKQSQHHTGCTPSEVVDLSNHSNDACISAASTATQQYEPPEILTLAVIQRTHTYQLQLNLLNNVQIQTLLILACLQRTHK